LFLKFFVPWKKKFFFFFYCVLSLFTSFFLSSKHHYKLNDNISKKDFYQIFIPLVLVFQINRFNSFSNFLLLFVCWFHVFFKKVMRGQNKIIQNILGYVNYFLSKSRYFKTFSEDQHIIRFVYSILICRSQKFVFWSFLPQLLNQNIKQKVINCSFDLKDQKFTKHFWVVFHIFHVGIIYNLTFCSPQNKIFFEIENLNIYFTSSQTLHWKQNKF